MRESSKFTGCFLKRAVPTALEMAVRMCFRKFKAIEYDWCRKHAKVATS